MPNSDVKPVLRRWYCCLSNGRVGRRQALPLVPEFAHHNSLTFLLLIYISSAAGWSSPVARQAHNLKVIGSNPIPATILIYL